MKLPELKSALQKLQAERPYLFQGELQISEWEKSTNIEATINSHIAALEANSGNRTFLPFYERLLRIYQILSNANT